MRIGGEAFRTIWPGSDAASVQIIDQTRLPHEFEIISIKTASEAARAIKDMQVRGAPPIWIGRGRGMKGVELYGRVRYAVQIEGLSHREAARQFGIDPRTVAKMVKFSVPPGYVRKKPPARPKLDPFILVIDGILLDEAA